MTSARAVLIALCVLLVAPASAQSALPDDGKRWRQVTETVGVTAARVAEMCPRDGETRCSGDYAGWIWATDAQIVALFGHYVPEILTADPPAVGGPQYIFQAATFLGDIRATFNFSGYSFSTSSVAGWTASSKVAHVGWTHPIFDAGFGIGPAEDGVSWTRGAWLWRPITDDITKPVVTPNVSGTLGTQGWHTSNVSVSWSVSDPESAVEYDCPPASVTEDTAGITFTCTATSGGGTTTVSTTVKRDATPPVITCSTPMPVVDFGSLPIVRGTATDANWPAPVNLQIAAPNTQVGNFTVNLVSVDRAGNRATKACPYAIVIPLCNGKTPTIVGTPAGNVINGTPGPDVIVGLTGNDTIDGRGGDDTICGGEHTDSLNGGDGNDWLDGGLGTDSLRGDGGRDTCLNWETRNSSCEAGAP